MSRAYIVYIFMFAILAGGMWVILTFGRATGAPDDLAGDWNVLWMPPHDQNNPVPLRIEQSGRFFLVRVGTTRPLNMTLQPGWKGVQQGPNLQMQLIGEGWKMNISGKYPPAQPRISATAIELIGPTARLAGIANRAGVETGPTTPASPASPAPASRPSGMAHVR
jgi:hypothetical protein